MVNNIMILQYLFFPLLVFFNTLYYFIYNKERKDTTLLWHLVFMIATTFVWRDDLLLYNLCIYFVCDLMYQKSIEKLSAFTLFHHFLALFSITLVYNTDVICNDIVNLSSMHEFSTIFMCLYEMKWISEKNYDRVFPISFILCRLVVFNICLAYMYTTGVCNCGIPVLILLVLFNTMNAVIVYHLNLIGKIKEMII